MNKAIEKFWLFGFCSALALALPLSFVITAWSWLENPSGIFHDASGTNWTFVYDTAWSWFLPTFLRTLVIASMLHFLATKVIAFLQQRSAAEQRQNR